MFELSLASVGHPTRAAAGDRHSRRVRSGRWPSASGRQRRRGRIQVDWVAEQAPNSKEFVWRSISQDDLEEFMRVSVGPGGHKDRTGHRRRESSRPVVGEASLGCRDSGHTSKSQRQSKSIDY